MNQVPVSVVVPTVERPELLARCLDAVLDAEVFPAEVLVVDQGGAEATAEVLRDRTTPEVPVRHVRSELRGLSAARNLGLRHAAAPWVAFTDDDCVPDRGWLRAAVARLEAADDPDGVGGRVLPLGRATPDTHTLSLRLSTTPAVYRGRTLPWRVGTGGNMVLRADVLRGAGGYDERLGAGTPGLAGEDLEVVHRLLRAGAALAFEPAVVVYHDRVDARRRLASRRSYGFGMGVFAGLWLRSDPLVALVLTRWLFDRSKIAVRAVRRRDRWRMTEERLMLSGALSGLRYGWRLRSPVPGSTNTAPPSVV